MGARYGTTSCEIASKLENSGQLISVEPDYRVWNILDENRRTHNCNFWLLRGVISNHSVSIDGNFYSTRSIVSNSNISTINSYNNKQMKQSQYSRDNCNQNNLISNSNKNINNNNNNNNILLEQSKQYYTIEEIQYVTNITLTVLLIDCEGCINNLFYNNNNNNKNNNNNNNNNNKSICNIIKNIKTIILEADMPIGSPDCAYDCVDYSLWKEIFSTCGLRIVYNSQDPVFPKIYHYVFQR